MQRDRADNLQILASMRRHWTAAPGFVLIELLIAAAIAALLITTVLVVYGSVLNTVSMQRLWRDKATPAADALDVIIRDLACAVVPFGVTSELFCATFSDKSEEKFRMSFYSAFPTGSSNDWHSYSIGRVCYSLRPAIAKDEFVLVRECSHFRVPSRNPLSAGQEKWKGITRLSIDFFDGSSWTNQWGRDGGTNNLPQAARLKLVSGQNNPREIESEVFIHAGRQISAAKSP